MYKDGVKIKYPKGFFSEMTSSERGTWTNKTKKAYEIGPYSSDDKAAVQDRIQHRRERERVNKTNERERRKLKQLLHETLGKEAAEKHLKQKPQAEVKYNSADIKRLLSEYGKMSDN